MLHVMRWHPCHDRFVFVIFEERAYGAHYARYIWVSHLPKHTLKGRVVTVNKGSILDSREVSILFVHEHLAQSFYEYINSLTKGG